MNALNARRDEDLAKLKDLERRTGGRIRVTSVCGNPVSQIGLKLMVRTAGDDRFPSKVLTEVNATIQLRSRYPFEEPLVAITTKVFNPNVYTNGRVCMGAKWQPTEFLDLLVQRLFKILAFDPSIVNPSSPANGDAARWYKNARLVHETDFPSDSLPVTTENPTPAIKWTDKSGLNKVASSERLIVICPSCQKKLRLPADESGTVQCPACNHSFRART